MFRAYVAHLVSEGVTQEFFIEGGRSRTGKTLAPRLGILNWEVEAFLGTARRDLFFVPVAITYERLVEEVPRANFPGIDEIAPGMRFETQMDDGSPMVVTVVAADAKSVTVDGNHPLAGKDLTFDLEITLVRDATSEEIEHGHVHLEGEGCHLH